MAFPALIVAPFLISLALYGLYIALYVSKDYRKRRVFWDKTRDLDNQTLRDLFGACIVKLVAFRQSPKRVPAREAEAALVLATVLREHAMHRAGKPLPTYLRSRHLVLRHAQKLARLHTP